jgi:hypothetical protein
MSSIDEIGRMALKDRDFFEALLKDPQAALAVKSGTTEVSETDLQRVVELFDGARKRLMAQGLSHEDIMRAWEENEGNPEWSPEWYDW